MTYYKFYFLLILMVSSHFIIGQTNYNKGDDKEKKYGLWKGFYEDSKRIKYEGVFEHRKEVEIFTFYDDTKAKPIVATRVFDSTDNSAYTIFYDQLKNRVSEGRVINKLFDGQWKYYHQVSKVVMTLENYKNGKFVGLRSVYYPSGKIAEETNYRNNLKGGRYKSFSKNGIVLEESIYKNNEYNGAALFRDPSGNVVSKGDFFQERNREYGNFLKMEN